MEIVAFAPRHLTALRLQPAQAHIGAQLDPAMGRFLRDAGPAFTALDGGQVIACAGTMELWSGRWQAWALLSACGPRRFLDVHRAVLRFLDGQGARRIETAVDCDFKEGHRWARALGFSLEAPCLRGYTPDGRDAALYARFDEATGFLTARRRQHDGDS